jgi:hypothetical protein
MISTNNPLPMLLSIKRTALHPSLSSHIFDTPMKGTPYTPDPFILTNHILPPNLPILHPGILNQQLSLLHNLLLLQVPHTDGFLLAIYVVSAQDGMFVRAWGDVDAEFGMGTGERWEETGGEEGAVREVSRKEGRDGVME